MAGMRSFQSPYFFATNYRNSRCSEIEISRFQSPEHQEKNMLNIVAKLWKDEEGQDLVEYGLLVVLIALFAVVAMQGLANGISDAFSNATAQMTST
jgi:pilus assembly protein Flp/PilA